MDRTLIWLLGAAGALAMWAWSIHGPDGVATVCSGGGVPIDDNQAGAVGHNGYMKGTGPIQYAIPQM